MIRIRRNSYDHIDGIAYTPPHKLAIVINILNWQIIIIKQGGVV